MPYEEPRHRTSLCMLSDDYTIEYDHDTRWMTLLLSSGTRLNFSPETTQHLRNFFDALTVSRDQKATHILSDEYRVTYDHGLLTLLLLVQKLEFSCNATERFHEFLDSLPNDLLKEPPDVSPS